MAKSHPPKPAQKTCVGDEVLAAREQTLALSPDEQLAFWNALNEPPTLTQAQRRLGALMRGES